MRINTKSAMLRMPSLLESRISLLHLWTSSDWKRIQPKFSPMATGCFLNPALRHQKGATSWCSALQNWGTETAFLGPQCAEEMYQEEFWWNSRSLPTRFSISIRNSNLAWPKRSASRWIKWHKKTTPTSHPLTSTRDIRKTGISHWTNQAEMHRWNSDQTSEKQMNTGGAHKLKNVNYLWDHGMSSKEQDDFFWTFTHQDTQSGILTFFYFVVAISLTADGNLLQPTGCVNRTPSHVTFSRVCTHV